MWICSQILHHGVYAEPGERTEDAHYVSNAWFKVRDLYGTALLLFRAYMSRRSSPDVASLVVREAHKRNKESFFTDQTCKPWTIPVKMEHEKTSQDHFRGRMEAVRDWVCFITNVCCLCSDVRTVLTETGLPSPYC